MRNVAVALAVMTLIAALPTVLSADECATPGSGSACVPIDASRPNSPPGFPQLPQTAYWGKYYLWIGAGHCITLNLNDCRGFPAASGSGIPLPDGGTAPIPGIFGILYEETNGAPGLQRFFTSRSADRMILI